MKHKLLLVGLLMLFPLFAMAQEALLQPTRADMNLQGRVMKVVSLQRYTSGTDMNFEEEWNYEQNGSLVSHLRRGFGGEKLTTYPQRRVDNPLNRTDYDRDGDPVTSWTYGSTGQLLGSKHYIYGAGGTLAVVVEYAYDAEENGTVVSRKLYQYDKMERLVDVYMYSVDETLLMEEHYRYDRYGNQTQKRQLFYDDTKRTETKEQRRYKYDKQGNWVHCDYFHDGIQISTTSRTITYF